MDEEYQIVYVEKPEWGIIGEGITNYSKQQVGNLKEENLCFVLRAPDQEILGGVIGATYWAWFYINLMWIKEDFRGRGFGHRLLVQAEALARQRGARNAYLDTFSFQAPDFYKKHGYQVFGELKEFPPGHQRYFLKKEL